MQLVGLQGFKLIQHLAPECLRFSGESTAFGIGEMKAPPTHALLKHAVLFLQILNHVQLQTSCPIPQPRSTSNGIVRLFGQYDCNDTGVLARMLLDELLDDARISKR